MSTPIIFLMGAQHPPPPPHRPIRLLPSLHWNSQTLTVTTEVNNTSTALRSKINKKMAYGNGCASADGGPLSSFVLKITMKNELLLASLHRSSWTLNLTTKSAALKGANSTKRWHTVTAVLRLTVVRFLHLC